MSDYLSFLAAHWLLSTAFIIILLLLLANEVIGRQRSAKACSPQQLVQMMNHSEITLIDVRGKDEYRNGKIAGSKSIPFNEFSTKIASLDNSKPVVLICDNGQQSSKQAQLLKEQQFDVYYLAGGLAAWKNENLPLAK